MRLFLLGRASGHGKVSPTKITQTTFTTLTCTLAKLLPASFNCLIRFSLYAVGSIVAWPLAKLNTSNGHDSWQTWTKIWPQDVSMIRKQIGQQLVASDVGKQRLREHICRGKNKFSQWPLRFVWLLWPRQCGLHSGHSDLLIVHKVCILRRNVYASDAWSQRPYLLYTCIASTLHTWTLPKWMGGWKVLTLAIFTTCWSQFVKAMLHVMRLCLTTADMQRTAIVALARASEKWRNATPWRHGSVQQNIWLIGCLLSVLKLVFVWCVERARSLHWNSAASISTSATTREILQSNQWQTSWNPHKKLYIYSQ